jgi:hypothetical protein
VSRPVRLAWILVLSAAAVAIGGCERLARLGEIYRDMGLEFHYVGTDAGVVERSSVSVDTRVIASARKTGARPGADPSVTEVEVAETHFVRGTLDVVYTGRITFACVAEQPFCSVVRVTPTSGTRPRELFWRWPAWVGAGMPAPRATP